MREALLLVLSSVHGRHKWFLGWHRQQSLPFWWTLGLVEHH